jgi:hypothetical protein
MTDDELDQRVLAAVLAEQIDTAPLERSIRERIQRSRLPRWAVAAAASVALAIGGGLAYRTFSRQQTPPICVAAAQDHEREIVKGEPRRWLTTLSAIESLAEKLGVPASAIAALSTTGYKLERGRLCFLKKQIFLHLVYTRNGDELSVYLRPRGSDLPFDGSVRQTSIGPEDLAYFQTDRLTAVFVDEWRGQAGAFARAGAKVL